MIHTVEPGEYLSAIARQYGFSDYRVIWDHPENAKLKGKRKNPSILYPGDQLFIPVKETGEENGPTEQRHRFRLKGKDLMLRLMIRDLGHQPLANTFCELHVGNRTYDLTTDDEGRIEQEIPFDSAEGLLLFTDPLIPFQRGIRIKIGHLDPIEEVSGQQARLNNLGYDAGPVDGKDGEKLRFALQEFQCDQGLKVDGVCDAGTQAKLKEIHGC